MDHKQAALAAIGHVRDGEGGTTPTELDTLTPEGRERVLAAARRYRDADADRVVDAMVDQLASELARR